MNEIPDSFMFEDLICYRSRENPALFFYIPGEPVPECGPDGVPTISLMMLTPKNILQLGVRWVAEQAILTRLMNDLVKKNPDLLPPSGPSPVKISVAPVSVREVVLTVVYSRGDSMTVFKEKSSEFSPFTTLFNAPLSPDDGKRAAAALGGERNILQVSYKAILPVEYRAEFSIKGSVKAEVTTLSPDATHQECLESIKTAIEKGNLDVSKNADTKASAGLIALVEQTAFDDAADKLLKMVPDPSWDAEKADLEVSVRKSETADIEIVRTTDIGTWFPDGNGKNRILEVKDATDNRISGSPARVSLGFSEKDLPVAFIEVKTGESSGRLAGPRFDPVTLDNPGGDLMVRTNYTDGGRKHEVHLPFPGGDGWSLGPGDLGIVRISIDGSRLKDTGCKEARVHVSYMTSGRGTDDDQVITLGPAGVWSAAWYVISRAPDLAGSLAVDWRETAADGSVKRHPPVTSDRPNVIL